MNEKAAETASAPEKKKKKSGGNWLLVLVLLLGLGLIAYPTVSDWWNSFHATRAIASYTAAVDSTDDARVEELLEAAREYNSRLLQKENPFSMTEEEMAEYRSLLDVSGTGIIGYVQIPLLRVNVPVYHTTEESVLQVAVGHLEWSSLPIGGESTHSAISGHRGLPSARLFTDLDKMKEGDTFTITVLNQTVPGEDYCTLVTCTPYGINTHRMLVRGRRIENLQGELVVPPEAHRVPNYITIPAVGIPLLFVFLAVMLVLTGRKRQPVELKEVREELIQKVRKEERAREEKK